TFERDLDFSIMAYADSRLDLGLAEGTDRRDSDTAGLETTFFFGIDCTLSAFHPAKTLSPLLRAYVKQNPRKNKRTCFEAVFLDAAAWRFAIVFCSCFQLLERKPCCSMFGIAMGSQITRIQKECSRTESRIVMCSVVLEWKPSHRQHPLCRRDS